MRALFSPEAGWSDRGAVAFARPDASTSHRVLLAQRGRASFELDPNAVHGQRASRGYARLHKEPRLVVDCP